MIETKPCEHCGTLFELTSRQPRKYCSDKCGKKAWEKLNRKKNELRVVKCIICSKEFTTRYSECVTVSFCSDNCKQKHHYHTKVRTTPLAIQSKCEHCDKDFEATGANRERQRFCSEDCHYNFFRIMANNKAAERRSAIVKQCRLCGKDFTPKRTTKQLYCSWRCCRLIPNKILKAIHRCLEYAGNEKTDKTETLLGYKRSELLQHVRNHPNWDRVKDAPWDLDHVFPIKAFLDHGITDISIICRLDNLQPLERRRNNRKKDKYNTKHFRQWLTDRNIPFSA